jgi:hypothetical protein
LDEAVAAARATVREKNPTMPDVQAEQIAAVLTESTATFEPHRLCGYLFSLAKAYSDFYEACPVCPPGRAARGPLIPLNPAIPVRARITRAWTPKQTIKTTR